MFLETFYHAKKSLLLKKFDAQRNISLAHIIINRDNTNDKRLSCGAFNDLSKHI